MTVRLVTGDCREALKALPDASIDAIVTDPPAGIAFMGRDWDHDKGGRDAWVAWLASVLAECLRVAKPGAHAFVWALPRTSGWTHRALEDSGWEVKDCVTHITGQGFPKSLDVQKAAIKAGMACVCEGSAVQYRHVNLSRQDLRNLPSNVAADEPLPGEAEQDVLAGVQRQAPEQDQEGQGDWTQGGAGHDPLQDVRYAGSQTSEAAPVQRGNVLLLPVSGEGAREPSTALRSEWQGQEAAGQGAGGGEQSSVEGRSDLLPQARQLQADQVRPLPSGVLADGTQGRLRDGASAARGAVAGSLPEPGGSGAPHRPRPTEQRSGEPPTIPQQLGPQTCRRCGKAIFLEGLGTALKPAAEFWYLARKPLAEKSIAANVERYGTGALNIDGCRIEAPEGLTSGGAAVGRVFAHGASGFTERARASQHILGRWPANLILDEAAAALLDASVGTLTSGANPTRRGSPKFRNAYGEFEGQEACAPARGADSGGPSRFFYCAKSSTAERNAGLEGMPERIASVGNTEAAGRDGTNPSNYIGGKQCRVEQGLPASEPRANHHPTVKPLSLMKWLLTLVVPPGGTVLDPFLGSGSTGCAAVALGFDFIGIEEDSSYIEIARRRIEHAQGPMFAAVEVTP